MVRSDNLLPFRLVFPWRTFYLCATTDVEAKEWVEIIQWKLVSMFTRGRYNNSNKNKSCLLL